MSDMKNIQGQQSNADRIRAMTDTELLNFLHEIIVDTEDCKPCPVYESPIYGVCSGGCRKGLREWLKSPVEV